MRTHKRWIFVVDTDDYGGNFERELGWYVTGYRPEHMSGGSDWVGVLADAELKEVMDATDPLKYRHIFDDYFSAPGENQNYVEVWPSPPVPGSTHARPYNSVAIHMCSLPNNDNPKVFELMKERALRFPKLDHPRAWTKLHILGFRLIEVTTSYEEKTL